MNKKILAIIPARGGSKGISRKNIRIVGGKPLIAWTIEAAINSGVITKVVVSTEDREIEEISKQYGADIIKRPQELSGDNILTEPVMLHALNEIESRGFTPDYIALIQCTSPFLSAEIIRNAIVKMEEGEFDSCITVFYPEGYEFKWKKLNDGTFIPEHDIENRPRRQDMDLPYHENGAFYITKTDLFKSSHNRFGGNLAKVTAVEMTEADSLQIDSDYHLWLADQRLKKENDKF